jgi:hypothetical protein
LPRLAGYRGSGYDEGKPSLILADEAAHLVPDSRAELEIPRLDVADLTSVTEVLPRTLFDMRCVTIKLMSISSHPIPITHSRRP